MRGVMYIPSITFLEPFSQILQADPQPVCVRCRTETRSLICLHQTEDFAWLSSISRISHTGTSSPHREHTPRHATSSLQPGMVPPMHRSRTTSSGTMSASSSAPAAISLPWSVSTVGIHRWWDRHITTSLPGSDQRPHSRSEVRSHQHALVF
jgi:hypothetical protein